MEKNIVKNITKEKVTKNIENKQKREKASFYLFFKRAVDIIGSSLGLIVLSPFFLIIAIAIKIDDKGTAFYKHKRVGQFGKELYIYKFRSMKMNADKLEEMLTPQELEVFKSEFKLENDPRITKVGKFLRKTSLDELPQLLNILKGDLTLIGPRPIVEEELENYGEDAQKLLSVKPGLTGYWQAYARNDAVYATGERQKMELYYVDNRNFVLDVKIFFMTFVSVFRKTGN